MGALEYIASTLALITFITLIISPAIGICLLFIAKPVVDAVWGKTILFDLPLTQLIGVAAPAAILLHVFLSRGEKSFHRMPLVGIWTAYALYVLFASLVIVLNDSVLNGLQVFFRQISGFTAFFIVQAYFHELRRIKWLLYSLLTAGIFPTAVGVYQALTGVQWRVQQAEGIIRYGGLYHDIVTVRLYALQTLMALLLLAVLYRRKLLPGFYSLQLGYAAATLSVLVQTYSKAAFVIIGVWTLIWTVTRKRYLSLILLITVTAVLGAWFFEGIAQNIAQLFHKETGALLGKVNTDLTFQGRWFLWKELWDEWQQQSLFAMVFGSGKIALGTHNDFLLILFHLGIIGLVIYLILLAALFKKILANVRERADPLAVSALMLFAMLIIDSIGLTPSAYSGYQWFVWGMIGLSLRMRMVENKAKVFAASGTVRSEPVAKAITGQSILPSG